MGFDPYMIIAGCFSKWIRVQILMGFIVAWCIILLGLSGWLYESYPGSISSENFPDGVSYKSWTSSVCNSSPYIYMRPFQFSYTRTSGWTSSTSPTCGWPNSNSYLRFCIGTVGTVVTLLLFFKTPLSWFARPIYAAFALLFFSAAVLDANNCDIGTTSCNDMFKGTDLYYDLSTKNITISCTMSNYAGLVVIDVIISATFFLLHTAWSLCKDLYIIKK